MSERTYYVAIAIVVVLTVGIIASAVSFTLGQSISSTSDVRIVAQKLEDGRIEFGLQQDGERILPRSRYFPADARVGRWLRSSPIGVDVEAAQQPTGQQPETPDGRSISGSGDAYRSAGHFSAGNYVCSVSVAGNNDDYGAEYFAVVSYGDDGSYGALHASEIASSYTGSSRLTIGSGWSADLPTGQVYFEVKASSTAHWTISCR